MEEKRLVLDVWERPKWYRWILLSLQHVFAMFGATVLVPILTGLDVGVALIGSGVGTLIYIALTKAKVPMYLGSSFAYIAAITTSFGASGNFNGAFTGIIAVGIIYCIVATIIHFFGVKWLKWLLPSVIVGPMIIVIGLSLAPVAISNIITAIENV
ncbi:MAG TPA: uracil permease, partial [Acholeplasmataceae bacterium]|nr:uracil permease [Acholeplasmataceae bacterium]